MYIPMSIIESIIRVISTTSKITYYKIKYGNRLKIGKKVHFRRGFIINIAKNGKVIIGDRCFFNNYCSINCHDKITIGNDNLFGENVKIYDHNHIFNNKNIDIKRNFKSKPIELGNGNWICSNVILLSGTKIGNNNVIGASLVVNNTIGSEYIVRNNNTAKIEKIKFKQ